MLLTIITARIIDYVVPLLFIVGALWLGVRLISHQLVFSLILFASIAWVTVILMQERAQKMTLMGPLTMLATVAGIVGALLVASYVRGNLNPGQFCVAVVIGVACSSVAFAVLSLR